MMMLSLIAHTNSHVKPECYGASAHPRVLFSASHSSGARPAPVAATQSRPNANYPPSIPSTKPPQQTKTAHSSSDRADRAPQGSRAQGSDYIKQHNFMLTYTSSICNNYLVMTTKSTVSHGIARSPAAASIRFTVLSPKSASAPSSSTSAGRSFGQIPSNSAQFHEIPSNSTPFSLQVSDNQPIGRQYLPGIFTEKFYSNLHSALFRKCPSLPLEACGENRSATDPAAGYAIPPLPPRTSRERKKSPSLPFPEHLAPPPTPPPT